MAEPNRRATTDRRCGSPVILALLALLVVECGRETSPPDPAPEGPVTAVVGPAGATLSTGNATLVVPPGALSTEVEISMTPVTDPPWGVVGPAYDLRPEGLAFAEPVTLSLDWEGVEMPAGVEEVGLRIVTRADPRWRLVEGGGTSRGRRAPRSNSSTSRCTAWRRSPRRGRWWGGGSR